MSTHCLTIHDLLRITYTYEAQSFQAQAQAQAQTQAQRTRSDSACSMPEVCSHLSPPTSPSPEYAILETDFTQTYSRNNRREHEVARRRGPER
ncbi:hypothetical protein EJ02DRAFT_341444 [Clathrospora elynae]|uniref:Uncharacterized protein n=1 Tax=Clathrospora elynae TaxID=706981 RepID=A0A6A5SUW7_9PLEO|nr:hypothetical protein EJ02DRAFT_341444 [Clathrospora elynae]